MGASGIRDRRVDRGSFDGESSGTVLTPCEIRSVARRVLVRTPCDFGAPAGGCLLRRWLNRAREGWPLAKSCYQAPLRTEQLVKLLELSSFVEVVDGRRERALVRTIPDWMLKRSVAIRVIEAANFEREVLPLVTSLGDAELASLVGPSDWSRVAVMIDPEWPVAGPLGDVAVPLEIVFWIGVHAPELREQFGPKLACDEKSMREKVVGERVFSLPSVVFHPFLLDSAEFSSSFDAVANVGIQDRGLVQLSSRSDVPIPGGSAVKISFPAQCQVRKAGQPFAAPCWEERVLFPSQGLLREDLVVRQPLDSRLGMH